MSVDVRWSATAIDTWRLCPRKWAWRVIDGIEGVQGESAALGGRVHKVLEVWLRDGMLDAETVEGQIALPGLKYLPQPDPAAQVEEWFELTIGGEGFHGRMDLRYRKQPRDADGRFGRLVVLDHKTTSDFKWAKSADDLRNDVQATMYAVAVMLESGEEEIELEWIYYRTAPDRPGAKKVSLVVLRDDAEAAWNELIAPTVVEMRAALSATTALELPPNATACRAFGGCPYELNCNLTPQEKMRSLMTQQTLAERLRAKMINNGAAPTTPTEPAAAPTPITTPVAAAPAAAAPAATEAAPAPKRTRIGKPKINPPESGTAPAENIQQAAAGAAEAAAQPVTPATIEKAMSTALRPASDRRLHVATAFFAASVTRGEPYNDEKERALAAFSRADALLACE